MKTKKGQNESPLRVNGLSGPGTIAENENGNSYC